VFNRVTFNSNIAILRSLRVITENTVERRCSHDDE